MWRKNFLTGILCILIVPGFAWQADPLSANADTLGQATQKIRTRHSRLSVYTVPAALVGYGLTSLGDGISKTADRRIRHELMEEYPNFSTRIDDKLQYAPVAAAYALSIAGVKSKNNLIDRTAMYLISNTIMSFSVDFIKDKTAKLRPSGHDRRSFPSGHTATAFQAAEFMRQEFAGQSPLYGYLGYAMATATGGLRMMGNHHWFSDVLAGVGVGILSTKLTYLAYPWIKKKIIRKKKDFNFMAVPLVRDKTVGFSAVVPL